MLKRLVEVAVPLKETSEQWARERAVRAWRMPRTDQPLPTCLKNTFDFVLRPNDRIRCGRLENATGSAFQEHVRTAVDYT